MNLLLLHLFARDAAGALDGAVLDTPRWYRPLLVVPWQAGRRRGHLVAVLEAPGPFVFLSTARPLEGAEAPERLTAVAGRRVSGVSCPPRDRVLRIGLEAGAGAIDEPLALQFHLYGAQGAVQVRRGDTVIDSVGGRRRPETGDRRRPSLADIDAASMREALAEAGDRPLRAAVPGLEEPLAAAFPSADGGIDVDALLSFRDGLLEASAAFSLAAGKRAARAVPVPVADPPDDGPLAGPFRSAIDAAGTAGALVLADTKRRIVTALCRPVEKHLAAQEKLLENLHHDLARAEGHDRIRREAETLAAYQSSIRPGAEAVELPDVYAPDTTVRIALDPSLPVRTQIDKRFRKATKLEKSEAHTRRRIDLVEREVRELRAGLTVVGDAESFAQALTRLQTLRDRHDLEPAGAGTAAAKKGETAATPFRRFDLGQGWFALVGKSSRDNDTLTFRHASPTDLWFHAQSVPGSHVILKSPGPDTPPPAILQAAASIAAHFSKSRHSGLVPVIYTRRKYVRKFRGASPGQVRCEREKMVMVAPWLPEDSRK